MKTFKHGSEGGSGKSTRLSKDTWQLARCLPYYTPGGKLVVRISVAANRTYRDREGNTKEDTQWFNVEAWGKLAEIINTYLTQGDRVYIEGRLQTDRYEKDGETRYFTRVVARNLIMLGSNREGAPPEEDGDPV